MVVTFLGLLAALALLIVLKRQVHRHLQGLLYLLTRNRRTALILYALIFFPGVILHELSHWIAAKVLRVPTRGFSVIPSKGRDGMIRFGYVETAVTDPIRASLIGAAPLFAGGAAALALTMKHLGLQVFVSHLLSGEFETAITHLGALLQAPDLLFWLYLIFAIGNTMLPSKSDRASWISAAIVLAALGLLAILSGVIDWFGFWFLHLSNQVARNLTVIFVITTILNGVVLIPILTMESLTARIVGHEVVYDG